LDADRNIILQCNKGIAGGVPGGSIVTIFPPSLTASTALSLSPVFRLRKIFMSKKKRLRKILIEFSTIYIAFLQEKFTHNKA
jgi:hypothetical protein